jgi:hypothetical protein
MNRNLYDLHTVQQCLIQLSVCSHHKSNVQTFCSDPTMSAMVLKEKVWIHLQTDWTKEIEIAFHQSYLVVQTNGLLTILKSKSAQHSGAIWNFSPSVMFYFCVVNKHSFHSKLLESLTLTCGNQIKHARTISIIWTATLLWDVPELLHPITYN